MAHSTALSQAISFLRKVGLQVSTGGAPLASFTPGVGIAKGSILVDIDTANVSDLLHEAGHVALVPACARHMLSGDVEPCLAAMWDQVQLISEPVDSPYIRALLQASDPEATAWAWAAGVAIGLAPEEVVRDEDYDATGAEVRFALATRCWPGINGLAHAGLTRLRGHAAFPQMIAWTQNAEPVNASSNMSRPVDSGELSAYSMDPQ